MDIESKNGKKIIVDIFSDIACPWCYVGETKFKLAREAFITQNPNIEVVSNYHAYMIDPQTKKNGEDYLKYNQRRWGGDGWTYSLRSAGKKVGCNFADWKIWPNTFLAHCLMTVAGKSGKSEQVRDEIFRLCYELGQNISDESVLDKIAQDLGIDSAWKSKETQNKVLAEDRSAKDEYDIHGVPFFLFENGKALEGAQDPRAFIQMFNSLV